MDGPNVRHSVRDAASNVTYHVMAYRSLSRDEVLTQISVFLGSRGKKRPPKNKVFTILTTIGMGLQ